MEGRLQTRNIEDKVVVDDKIVLRQKQVVEILADNILLLDGKLKMSNGKGLRYDENHSEEFSSDYQYESEYYDDQELKFDDDEFNFDFDSSEFNSNK